MKNSIDLAHTMDDIVFDGRNKSYGAYVLRQRADKHMMVATLVSILFFLLTVNTPKILALIKGNQLTAPEPNEIITVTLTPAPIVEPVRPTPPPAPKATPPLVRNQIQFVPPVVVNDTEDTPDECNVPTVEQLEHEVIGTETTEGTADGTDPSLITPEGSGGTGTIPVPESDEPFAFVEQMPSFPGGMDAMYAFINKHIKFPRIARENNISGTVVLQFVVSREGEILDARVIRKIGGGLDEEALRVVNLMPRWKPGMHNGREVPVTFTLPVKFEFM